MLSADEYLPVYDGVVGCETSGGDGGGDVMTVAAGGVVARGGVISAGKVCKGLTSPCSSSETEELAISLSLQKTLPLLTTFGGSPFWLPVEEGRGKK